MIIEGQGHFFTIFFPGFVFLCFTRPRYQVSVYRTIGPLVIYYWQTSTQRFHIIAQFNNFKMILMACTKVLLSNSIL